MRRRILIAAAAALAAAATGTGAARATACPPPPAAALQPLVLAGPATAGAFGFDDGDLLEGVPSASAGFVDGPPID